MVCVWVVTCWTVWVTTQGPNSNWARCTNAGNKAAIVVNVGLKNSLGTGYLPAYITSHTSD